MEPSTYGIWAPELRVTFFPRDMVMGILHCEKGFEQDEQNDQDEETAKGMNGIINCTKTPAGCQLPEVLTTPRWVCLFESIASSCPSWSVGWI